MKIQKKSSTQHLNNRSVVFMSSWTYHIEHVVYLLLYNNNTYYCIYIYLSFFKNIL